MKKYLLLILQLLFLFILLLNCPSAGSGSGSSSGSGGSDDSSYEVIRNDNAAQLTFTDGIVSSQNPAFSPDGQYILFTRFLNGYNEPPSQLVKININTGIEEIIISASTGVEHISVPGPVWINGKITWSSDLPGNANEIYRADEDGITNREHTTHAEADGYYIEPVFNPLNNDKVIFEYVISDSAPHQIAIAEFDKANNPVTILTNNSLNDDRLPSWSFDGTSILFQRANAGQENWQIYTAPITLGNPPTLGTITKLKQPENSANCDNSWFLNNNYILSSSDYEDDYNITMPNIFAFPVAGGDPIRITITSTNEDGAPSCSHDGLWIAFESHYGQDEDTPSDIWIIKTPNLP